ncbi:MAG: AMP-binding protein, partial [Streptococcaceae bacterium]|nr:AMP-binding protein [Streptococcaceae bacterium]
MKLLEKILEVAKENATKFALAQKDEQFTYKELFDAITQIMSIMNAEKLNDRPIFIFGKNDFLTLSAMLAVNMTGRAYIPVDAHTPIERTQMILEASKPALVITTVDLEIDYAYIFSKVKVLSFTKYARNREFSFDEVDT